MATATKRRAKVKPSANGKPKPTQATATKVYSYIRFSTPEQAEGDSERRQTAKAKAWADKHGYTFDESLRADRGLSGSKGDHRKKGNLGKFLKRVEAGEIPTGSILAVEELRRLTREGIYVGLKDTIFKLFEAGITIQTLTPEMAFNRENVETGMQGFILMFLLQIAHEESRVKSDWGKESWSAKRADARDQGKLLTNMVPAWIECSPKTAEKRRQAILTKDGKTKAIPAAAKTILMIFQQAEKKQTEESITKELNAKAPWTPPPQKKRNGKIGELTHGWNKSYVKKILRNRAVLGEHQPYKAVGDKRVPDGPPIQNFWPNLLAKHPGLFESVQRNMKTVVRKNKGGNNGKGNNILITLVDCSVCGGTMYYKDDGSGRLYLYCQDGRIGRTKCQKPTPSIRYDETLAAVINQCSRLKPEQLVPNQTTQAKLSASLRQRLQRQEGVKQAIQEKINSVHEQIKVGKPTPKRRAEYEQWLDDYEVEMAEALREIADTQGKLQKAERSRTSFADWQNNIAKLEKIIVGDRDENIEARKNLNRHLRDFIDRIEIFANGNRDGDEDDFGDWLAAAEHEVGLRINRPQRQQFVKWVEGRRRTKAGRFLRIHFNVSDAHRELMRNGKGDHLWAKDLTVGWGDDWKGYIDVVPHGSIAGHPNPGPLWAEFTKITKNAVPKSG